VDRQGPAVRALHLRPSDLAGQRVLLGPPDLLDLAVQSCRQHREDLVGRQGPAVRALHLRPPDLAGQWDRQGQLRLEDQRDQQDRPVPADRQAQLFH